MEITEFELSATTIFFIVCFLFICFRVVAFNFFWKNKKRKLSLIYDALLMLATVVWLIAIYDIWRPIPFSIDNSITQLAAAIFIFVIFDVLYNWYNLKHESKMN